MNQFDDEHKTCCCNCQHQISINCHPWNSNIGVGSISETFGWGCMGLADDEEALGHKPWHVAIFSESKHSMCELFKSKIKK